MKTNKVIVGALSAAMLSLSVCSVAPVVAAGETVQVNVGTAKVQAGQEFSVDVSLAGIPASGIQSCDFAIKYDPSLITIDSVKEGAITATGADSADPSASMLSLFDSSIDAENGYVSLMWTTALDDASYWLNSDGVFCTVSGKAANNASGVASLEVIPTPRETYTGSGVANDLVDIGYTDASGTVISYDVKITDGAVEIGGSSDDKTLKGDANVDGEVNIADAVLILQWIANPDNFEITEQGMKNADVINNDGVTGLDALEIQKYEANLDSVLGVKQ